MNQEKKGIPGTKEDLRNRVTDLEKRVTQLEIEKTFTVNNQFEIWVDGKIRTFEYGPDLKKIVMPQSVGKSMAESRKIFYVERDNMVKERYPGKPTPKWV